MEKVLQALADDIALGLAEKLRQRKAVPAPPAPRDGGMLVNQMAQELVNRLGNVQTSNLSEQQILLQRLQQVESTLEKLATRIRSAQGEHVIGSDVGGEGSKYQNVDTLLKYVDGSGAEAGVKLVIMNFND